MIASGRAPRITFPPRTVTHYMDHLIEDNLACLEQGIRLLRRLSTELYARPCASCFDSAIGGHMRHNTDHYEQFLAGYAMGRIDYDARSRNREVETDPRRAVTLLENLMGGLREVPPAALDAAVEVRMDGGGAAIWTQSSVRRELQFLISHTIHHYALMVAIARTHGFDDIPAEFGVAPSTLKHRAA